MRPGLEPMIFNKIQVLCRRLNRLIQEHARSVSQSNSKVKNHDYIGLRVFRSYARKKRDWGINGRVRSSLTCVELLYKFLLRHFLRTSLKVLMWDFSQGFLFWVRFVLKYLFLGCSVLSKVGNEVCIDIMEM